MNGEKVLVINNVFYSYYGLMFYTEISLDVMIHSAECFN